MKKGDVIMIYEDPFTQKKEEGKAKLIEKYQAGSYPGDQEYWKVKFVGSPQTYLRWIKPN